MVRVSSWCVREGDVLIGGALYCSTPQGQLLGRHLSALPSSSGADPGFLKKGGGASKVYKQKKGGRRGSNFGPNVKNPTSWAKKGGPDPLPKNLAPRHVRAA